MPFDHLEIPDEIRSFHEDLRRRRESRYQRLMQQHQQMKKEEGFRIIRDIILILVALSAVLSVLGIIFHRSDKD